jgi:thioredoxin reductase (NADPH)
VSATAPDIRESRKEQIFPRLTPAQIARLEPHGKRMATRQGEILTEPGDRHGRLMVVISGAIEVVRPTLTGEELVVVHMPGNFSGEISLLRGVGGLVRSRVREAGEVLAIDPDHLRAIVQSDSELSELFMRAFILRRVGLISSQPGDVVLIGSRHSGNTLRLQQFLTRNGFPYVNLDVDSDASVQALLDRFHVSVDDVPVVLCRGKVLKNPGIDRLAECLGMNPELDEARVRDLVVIGAGPAGLAAAVYAASEGLDVLVVETTAPGGQAGSSSKIENYLGFPTGISGQALAGRALVQAQKFGAEITVASSAARLHCDGRPYRVETSGQHNAIARSVVIATGAEYRQIECNEAMRFVGAGLYYAATHVEAQLCSNEEVIVVGGGNSAGQAAVFLAGGCRHVHLLVRSDGLAASMSRYLIRRIEESANITLRTHTEIAHMEGDTQLERVRWRNNADGSTETRDIAHVFLMTGAVPNTTWLEGCVALDEKGFVRTGSDLTAQDLAESAWPLARPPQPFETNLPGIFAVGDVRCGSVKRVASAVGEGSACVQAVHRVLAE